MPRLTDYDRRAKVSNIQTKTTLTVSQFGTVREPNPDKIQIVAGDRLDGNDYIMVPYLWFREWGSRRCLRLNATNIAFLTERGYTDVQALIGCTITLEVVEKVNYGKRQPMVLITSIKPPQGKADPTPYRTERLGQLKTLREQLAELLHANGQTLEPIAASVISKMTTDEIEKLIRETEEQIANWRPQ